MCGRFFSNVSPDDLAQGFGVTVRSNLAPRYNIAPTQPVSVVRLDTRGRRELVPMRWGLVPSWAREIGSAPLINARAETVAEKPSFRGGYRYRRALVPVSGWYEWRTEAGRKMPYAHTGPARSMLALACIWELWEGRGEGSWLESCALLTTESMGPSAAIHSRMPVLVHPVHYADWLGGEQAVLPRPSDMPADLVDQIVVTPAHPDVNKVANEGEYLLQSGLL